MYVLLITISWSKVIASASSSLPFKNSTVHLSIHPKSGVTAENIELHCHLHPSSSYSSLTLNKAENVYLVVETDHVKPSGILLKFNDHKDQCETNRHQFIQIDVCNATLISIRLNHTILNETLDKIDYSCRKSNAQAISSYRIISK